MELARNALLRPKADVALINRFPLKQQSSVA
jgi:hypothetical protein